MSETPVARMKALSVEPRAIVFEAESSDGMSVTFRRHFWDFWMLERLDDGLTVQLGATEPNPLITATLPAGEAIWRLKLERPMEATLGIAISVLAALVCLALLSRDRLTALLARRRGGVCRSRGGVS